MATSGYSNAFYRRLSEMTLAPQKWDGLESKVVDNGKTTVSVGQAVVKVGGVVTSTQGTVAETSEKVGLLERTVGGMANDTSSLKQELALRPDVETVKQMLGALQEGLDRRFNAFSESLTSLGSTVADLVRAVADLVRAVADLQADSGKTRNDIEQAKPQLAAALETLSVVDRGVASLTQEAHNCKTKLAGIDAQLDAIVNDLREMAPADKFSREWITQTFPHLEVDDEAISAIEIAEKLKQELEGERDPELLKLKVTDGRLAPLKRRAADADLIAVLDAKNSDSDYRKLLCEKMQTYILTNSVKR